MSHQGDFWAACAQSGATDPLSSFYPRRSLAVPAPCTAPSTGSTEFIHTQKLFLARTENENSLLFFFFSIPPNPQRFSSAEANGTKKGNRQHIKHYPFNPAPVPHLPMSASCPSFLWLSSLLLSACCLWFAPSGCYCFDLLNFCNPDPNPRELMRSSQFFSCCCTL